MSSDQSHSPNVVTPAAPEDRAIPTVLIASQDVVAAWSQQVTAPADLIAIADADAHHAVDIITRTHPRVVVVEQAFAATTRGMTLVNALRSNPTLDGLDIRVLPGDGRTSSQLLDVTSGGQLVALSVPWGLSPTRRALRLRMVDGTTASLNGSPVELKELSAVGARVISSGVLRPHQAVRLQVKRDGIVHRADGTVAWSMVLPGSDQLTYHAGLEFRRENPDLLSSLLAEVDHGASSP